MPEGTRARQPGGVAGRIRYDRICLWSLSREVGGHGQGQDAGRAVGFAIWAKVYPVRVPLTDVQA